jgi:hypothetical protein
VICKFCNQQLQRIDHTNQDVFDIFLCENCLKPNFATRFRQVYYKGREELLAETVRIDEFFVIINYKFNLTTNRERYTVIHKSATGHFSASKKVVDINTIIDLPFHDPEAIKAKLRTYTVFS